uniref:NB-ARC domain-containing protein n=2 Tax=Triticinae TaxID=1648030 RepID=A0A453GK54_AEGTS
IHPSIGSGYAGRRPPRSFDPAVPANLPFLCSSARISSPAQTAHSILLAPGSASPIPSVVQVESMCRCRRPTPPPDPPCKLKAFFSRDNPAYRWITRPHNLVDVRKRIEEIENEGRVFNLVPQEQVERSRKNETFAASSDRGTSTGMQGRSAEKEKLIGLILRSEANVHTSIIPVVGLGGIGKTTLAQSVYADKRVDIFNIRAWVHVSEKFDLLKIMRAIIKSVDAKINLDNVTLQFLQDCLQDKLADKRYLIVLDDFWEEGRDNLE